MWTMSGDEGGVGVSLSMLTMSGEEGGVGVSLSMWTMSGDEGGVGCPCPCVRRQVRKEGWGVPVYVEDVR